MKNVAKKLKHISDSFYASYSECPTVLEVYDTYQVSSNLSEWFEEFINL